MTPQMQASLALAQWQELRNAGLTPGQRIEALMRDFFAPVPVSDFEYELTLRDVAMTMAEAA
jgi:hypothetical protein